ncbi:phosphate ABC transporter ATP-binding protein, partial [Synechococcus sp. H60.3]
VELVGSNRVGELVEFDRTEVIFNSPAKEATKDYVEGRFG